MLIIAVIGISSELDICRGAIRHHNGKVELVNEFVLVKINTDLIRENEDYLLELRNALESLREKITDGKIQRSIVELTRSVDDELQEKTPRIFLKRK